MYRWDFDLHDRALGYGPVHPVATDIHVHHHQAVLADEARTERLARQARRVRAAADASAPHRGGRVDALRHAVGHALIGLGCAIAGRTA